ncbi:ATP-dependent translocase ABCB1 isoform X3 [Crassostrea virginica]|uniref:Multidrug resistance protein 1-like isoform X3 n=1 Tax=Crassostrea virginica TaxID=6565 RepID=A0A8B8BTE2_CRAVI|nr:multidrug resistance protein 1-like isoform X3 [Crassostrea virginica]
MSSQPQLLGYTPTSKDGSAFDSMELNGKGLGKDSEGEDTVATTNGRPASASIADVDTVDVEEKDGKKEEKKEEPQKMVGAIEVFKYADCIDIILMIIGSLCAAIHGASLPCMIIVFGSMIETFVDSKKFEFFLLSLNSTYLQSYGLSIEKLKLEPVLLQPHLTNLTTYYNVTDFSIYNNAVNNDLLSVMTTFAIYYIAIGCGVLVMGYGQVVGWVTAAERQCHRIRISFFTNVMRQEIGWFDTHDSGELSTRLADDINKIHLGIGDKMGTFIQWMAGFFAGFAIGFAYGWKLTLVILAISPLLAGVAILMSKLVSSSSAKELSAYAKAGSVAEEVLGAIRTVAAFGGQSKECTRYNNHLDEAKKNGIKKGITTGWSMGLVMLVVFCSYGLGFWYGAKLIREDSDYDVSNVLIVFFSVLIGAFSLGHAAPSLQSLSTARGAAFVVYALIEQEPKIDSASEEGAKLAKVEGNLTLRNVKFRYPAREDVQVLKDVSLDISRGETVALVGSSGCGKSTIIQLLQRFYDPEEGEIALDGKNIKNLNTKWLRQNIGVVSQEPVLFATTIAENIRYGKEGISQQEIEAAAKMANAHDFIVKLPNKYETLVGERGAQMSGGQKQRIAIARALVKDPKILLLDEATSALDTESESVVQEALDKARAGRTTVVVAHRLSTIKTADKIAGFQEGVIVENGTHEQLMEKKGVYYTLVTNQTQDVDKEEEELIAEFIGEKEKRGLDRQTSHQAKSPLKTQLSIDKVPGVLEEEEEQDKKKKKKKKDPNEPPEVGLGQVLKMNSKEWPYILFGCLAAIGNGGVQPAFAVIFAEILGVFSEPDQEVQERKIELYVGLMCAIGGVSFFTFLIQGYCFGYSGEHLTARLRRLAFKAMLRQDISWFDDHKNTTGALTTRLATDASQVQGISGARMGSIVQSIANLGTAFVIAFIYGWKLTLLIVAFLPFIMIAGALQMKLLQGVAGQNKEALEEAGKTATESIENIRTVASLTKEKKMVENYGDQLKGPYSSSLKKAHLTAIAFSFATGILFFAYAAAFWFGAYLIKQDEMDYTGVFKVFGAIVFGAMALGQASAFAPDAGKAKMSAAHIFQLLNSEPKIDVYSEAGQKDIPVNSRVRFDGLRFRYPTRPDVEVLQGLSLEVDPGETVALVGASGCGKSTTVQLVERFYDPEEGTVYLDNNNIKDLNIQWLRKQIGIVSQEPVLFDCSIAENIAYGDNSREVPMAEIIEAARKANIHNFIQGLPKGYETMCGDKGTQLSGGQKQRVAIARGLVRNPKILLLDEATSALDTESEKIVQEALDKAREGRTCIVIAHRLSTIQNADKICVIKHGQVAEQGRHSELMSKQGIYYRLVTTAQSRGGKS